MSPTITIQIGNRDARLTQRQWIAYVSDINTILAEYAGTVLFEAACWGRQHAVWIVEMKLQAAEARADLTDDVLHQLTDVRKRFQQESIAVTRGHTLLY